MKMFFMIAVCVCTTTGFVFGAASDGSSISCLVSHLAKGPNDEQAVKSSLAIIAQHSTDKLNEVHNGSTPLAWAALYGVHPAAKALCEKGVDVNTLCRSNGTALHAAASSGSTDILCLLLNKGANVHALTTAKQTVLHKALISRHKEASLLLILQTKVSWDVEDNFGNTALSLARKADMGDVLLWLEPKSDY